MCMDPTPCEMDVTNNLENFLSGTKFWSMVWLVDLGGWEVFVHYKKKVEPLDLVNGQWWVKWIIDH